MADRARPHRSSRSRSPQRKHSNSHRTRSPYRHHHKKRTSPINAEPKTLPYNARQLLKQDYKVFKPLLAIYLDLQKGKILEELGEVEQKGRWKSFIGKWNRGDISEGYYDPGMLERATKSAEEPVSEPEPRAKRGEVPRRTSPPMKSSKAPCADDSDSDDSIGPALPGQERRRVGPSIPNMQDLEYKRELDAEDGFARRDDIQYSRKQDRKEQKEALNELVPRAEAGTRERQLEKKKDLNEKMKGFRDKDEGAAEVPDQELMGGGDGIGEYKKLKEKFERKKTEREVRREEALRARMEEREGRLQEYRAKEDKTMAMLKGLARQKFGGGS